MGVAWNKHLEPYLNNGKYLQFGLEYLRLGLKEDEIEGLLTCSGTDNQILFKFYSNPLSPPLLAPMSPSHSLSKFTLWASNSCDSLLLLLEESNVESTFNLY